MSVIWKRLLEFPKKWAEMLEQAVLNSKGYSLVGSMIPRHHRGLQSACVVICSQESRAETGLDSQILKCFVCVHKEGLFYQCVGYSATLQSALCD